MEKSFFWSDQNQAPKVTNLSEDAMGGVEKRGGWKTSRMTPLPKRGFGAPPRTIRFPPLSGVSALFFSCTKVHDRADQKLFWRGPKIFRRARFLVRFPPPIRFAPPHITAQIWTLRTLIFFSLPFWFSLPFSFSRNSLRFWAFFPSFPRILGVRQAEEILAFWWVFLAVFQKGKAKKIRGLEGFGPKMDLECQSSNEHSQKPTLTDAIIPTNIYYQNTSRVGARSLAIFPEGSKRCFSDS